MIKKTTVLACAVGFVCGSALCITLGLGHAPAAQPEAAAAPAKPQQAKPQQAWPEEWLQTKGEPKKTATGSPAEGFPAKPDDPAS